MSDNPFEESDRTIIRPGGKAPPPRPAAASPTPEPYVPPPPVAGESVERIAVGDDPLLQAATPLLQLLARMRNTLNPPNAADLRERAVAGLRRFEQQARDAGVPGDQLPVAHYALCASLDDVALDTPWGSQGVWASQSLISSFHQEVRSGERFFVLLDQMKQAPGKFLAVLELMYLCLSLGFMGKYRLSQRGRGDVEAVREDLYTIIMRQKQAAEAGLSPHWQGIAAPYRPARGVLPVWVVAAVGFAALLGLFVYASTGLAGSSDAVFDRMLAAPQATMPAIARVGPVQPPPPPPPSPEPTALDRLHTFLKPEIDQGLVAVLGTPSVPVVCIRNKGMFPSGSATLNAQFEPLMQRIGQALKEEQGTVQVIGYTDNQPIRTVKFPSNFQLSTARAQSAEAIIAEAMGDASRISAEGRAEADPVATNATPEGREENRRIEVVLYRPG